MSNILFTIKLIAKLTAIIRNFWWTEVREEANSKALCLRAWKDICAPKSEGGLGIPNIQAMNQTLILMVAWRFANDPHDLLHDVLKSKYFDESSIWCPVPNVPKSTFWASILKVLPILKSIISTKLAKVASPFGAPPGVKIGQLSMIILSFKNQTIITQPMLKIYGSRSNKLGIPSSSLLLPLSSTPLLLAPKNRTFLVGSSRLQVNATPKVLTVLAY
jgi:hypothetical protein